MRRFVIAGLALALLPTVAFAQSSTSGRVGPVAGSQEFSLSGTGTSNNDFDNGSFGLSASYGQYINPNLMWGVRQNLSWADNGPSSWIGSTRLALDYHFGEGKLRPFVGANLGVVYGDDVEGTGIVSPELGLKYYVNPTTFLMGMAEYQVFFESSDDINNNFDDAAFVYTVGMGFNF